MVIGVLGVVGAELVASVQLSCVLYDNLRWSATGPFSPAIAVIWFAMFVPALVLYCASHLRLFGRGVGGINAGLVTAVIGISVLITALRFDGPKDEWDFRFQGRLMTVGCFFTTLTVGIVQTTSRSFLIATIPPEKQGLVHAVASMGASLFTAIHMFVVQGVAFDTDPSDLEPQMSLVTCVSVFSGIGVVMMLPSYADRRTITDAPPALTLDRGCDDGPIFKLVKPFMFAISGCFLLQIGAPFGFMTLEVGWEAHAGSKVRSLSYRAIGVIQVGALIGSALFILNAFQGKGGLILFQIVAAIFIAGSVIAQSGDAFTAMYAFGGLGLGALRAVMFAFLAQTVTHDNTANGVGKFVSLGLMAQAIVYPLWLIALLWYLGAGAEVLAAALITIATLIILQLPSSAERENDPLDDRRE
jgi:hypothetical protein